MVTRDDVAKRAGTSAAVVSYVVNNGPRPVSAETRARVEQAIRDTNYRPNGVARALRGKRSHVLGLIVPDSSNPFFAELARVVEEEAYRRGRFLIIGNSAEDDDREAGYVRAFLERQVDGLILVSAGAHSRLRKDTRSALVESKIPIALVDRQHALVHASVLLVDNEQGASLATGHLVHDHGIREVGCLAGPKDLPVSVQRVEGWRKALGDAGVPPDSSRLLHSPFDRVQAFAVVRDWLESDQQMRGLFVCSDEQAMGVLRAARILKMRVPEDLAIVSFDGTPEADYTSPGLTTAEQPLLQIGRRAVELLLDETGLNKQRVEKFAVRLIVRGSCGCREEHWTSAGAYEHFQRPVFTRYERSTVAKSAS